MAAIGGAPESISLDGTELPVTAESTPEVIRGGFMNEVKPAQNRTSFAIRTAVLWSISSLDVLIDRGQDDLGFLQSLADRLDDFPVAITWPDGTIEAGVGRIDGEVKHNTGAATATISLKGGGELAKQ